jgi:type IV secretory pathway protease TraF
VEDRGYIRSSAEEDAATESAVLRHLLALHPTAVTLEELIRGLGAEAESFAQRDAVERAVGELIGAGLLHRGDSLLLPTQAALRFDSLLGE